MAWAGVPIGSVIVVVIELTGSPWWAGLGAVAAVLVVVGVIIGVPRAELAAQSLALLGFGGLAVGTFWLAPRVGMVLAGLVLAAHAGWDLVYYRRGVVVPRSLAEFCIFLDVPLGLGLVAIALVGW